MKGLANRVRNNRFAESAGAHFRYNDAPILKRLAHQYERSMLVGIEREDGSYSILGRNDFFYRTPEGFGGRMTHEDFRRVWHNNMHARTKRGDFEYVAVSNVNHRVWMINANVLCIFLNTILFLERYTNGASPDLAK